MGLIRPSLPDIDLRAWAAQPEPGRVRVMCRWWAVQGFGAPASAYLFYVLKIVLYVWLWTVFASRTPGIDGFANFGQWWADPVAFQKAIVWTLLFEVVGLGCGSGPLTGRYVPSVEEANGNKMKSRLYTDLQLRWEPDHWNGFGFVTSASTAWPVTNSPLQPSETQMLFCS